MSPATAIARSQAPTRDREVIRVSVSNENLGIADSLRRAFAAAAYDESSRDFEKLINELN